MGSIGKGTTSASRVNGLTSNLSNYDSRFSDDIVNSAKRIHDEFPEVQEISRIFANSQGSEIASMNGLGFLNINPQYLNNYDSTAALVKSRTDSGWLAGDGTIENTIIAHELGHNLDLQLRAALANHSPQAYETQVVGSDNWAKAYSYILGRNIQKGDTVNDIPTWDTAAKFIKMGNKTYSIQDFTGNHMSDTIVPIAIKNIQDNYAKYGYTSKPTETQLVSGLSGYSNYNSKGSNDYHTEIFAESYSNYVSYGKGANPLAKEIMKLTKQAYKSATSHKMNTTSDFYTKLTKYSAQQQKAKGGK